MAIQHYPIPSVRRLPIYLRFFEHMLRRGLLTISCTQIAEALAMDPTQIRKDLAMTGASGKPRIGYELAPLTQTVREFLGWNNASDAFLVGAGHLGNALLGYDFRNNGINIVAAFDVDPDRIGTTVQGVDVFPLEKLPNLARRLHVSIGILTVPPHAATEAAGVLLAGGIRAIWNFAPTSLDVPDDIIVEDVLLSTSLAVLCQKVRGESPSQPANTERGAE